jgi:hypothetical protein
VRIGLVEVEGGFHWHARFVGPGNRCILRELGFEADRTWDHDWWTDGGPDDEVAPWILI